MRFDISCDTDIAQTVYYGTKTLCTKSICTKSTLGHFGHPETIFAPVASCFLWLEAAENDLGTKSTPLCTSNYTVRSGSKRTMNPKNHKNIRF